MTGQGLNRGMSVWAGRLSRWYLRVPLKCLVFLVVTFLVLFPSPALFTRHLAHLRDLEKMVEPDAPELAAWDEVLRERLLKRAQAGTTVHEPNHQPSESLSPRRAQREIERFVYDKVRYQWDWQVWGAADYMPTVGEMFAKAAETEDGQIYEDCDGRAVMAASLMRRLGYQSSLVTDLRHVWVTTPQGEWMGPGEKKTVVSTGRGNEFHLLTVWANIPVSLSYGISVFPLARELAILVTAFLLLLHRRISRRAAAFGGLLLLQGLLFMRCGVLAPSAVPGFDASWPALIGILHALGGFTLVWTASHRARRKAGHNR